MNCNLIDPRKFGITELGALMARTSRDARGFNEIAASVKDIPQAERTEAIMKFVNYGHASILDLMEVALSFTDITMYQAARLFQFSPRGNGQEASTRYINNNPAWEATFEKKRVGGRLDNIREVIPVNTPTSVVLRQSLRDWVHVAALCFWSGQSDLDALGEKILVYGLSFLTPQEQEYVDNYYNSLTKPGTGDETNKRSQSMNRRMVELLLEDSPGEGVSFMRFNGITIIDIVEKVPFHIVRDLNRHRNRILTGWTTPDVYSNAPMGDTVLYRQVSTIEQFKYEFGTRTTSEADSAYAALYHNWAKELSDVL